jgi:phosphopantetheinyl transferase (holo-ACP synthase)
LKINFTKNLDEAWKEFISPQACLHFLNDKTEIDLSRLNLIPFTTKPYPSEMIERFLVAPLFRNSDWEHRWMHSRFCVQEVLAAGEALSVEAKDTLLSLSHTAGASVAVLAERKFISGIGIDIEWMDRELSSGVASKFIHQSEHLFNLSPLQMWVIKEACFKAYPDNAATQLSDYRIQSITETENSISGEVKIKTSILKYKLLAHSSTSTQGWFLGFSRF